MDRNKISKIIREEIEKVVNEGKWAKIMKGVRGGDKSGPWAIVAFDRTGPKAKVVGQRLVKIMDAIPAHYEDMKRKYPRAGISIEDKGGRQVYSESINEAGSLTKHELISKIIDNSFDGQNKVSADGLLNFIKRAGVSGITSKDIISVAKKRGITVRGKDLIRDDINVNEVIEKSGSNWVVKSKAGKTLGTHDTKEKALAQLGAIEANKSKG